MKHRYTKSCPPNLYSLFISSAVGSPTVLKYCKWRTRYHTAYEPLFSGFFWFFFPFDFRFDLCVKAKGHKKDLGRKNGRDNITTSYTCLVYVVDPVYLRHVLRRLELSIKPGAAKSVFGPRLTPWSLHVYSFSVHLFRAGGKESVSLCPRQ